jgi:uncharacterized RDD family membrane protein YckC
MVIEPAIETKNVQYAGLAIRTKAFAYDYLLISGYIILLAAVTMAIAKIAGLLGFSLIWPENPILADLMAFLTLVLPVALYFTLTESSPRQATWGKRKAGIRVVDANGGTLSRKRALVRSLLKLLPWQIAHTCIFHLPGWPLEVTRVPPAVTAGFVLIYVLVGFYIAVALISKKNRTPYDWAAGSYMIVLK